MDETVSIPMGVLMEDGQSFIDSQELDTGQPSMKQSLQSSDEGQIENIGEDEEKRSLYAVKLKEFAPLTSIFRQVPLRAQHGFSTFDIRFTSLDVVEQYICIGSNIGTVYIYNRKQQSMQKLRCEGYTSNITSVKILYSLDYLVACSTESGTIFIFKVPASEQRKEVGKFHVAGTHKHAITCLEWGQNGMKLFSGDAGGLVVYSEIDYLQNMTKSREVLKEAHPIVQLSYRPHMLLVSTTHRSLFCHLEETVPEVKQIGQKPRKCSGKFGAVFNQSQLDNDVAIYASRPGLRLWKADTNGVVKETMLLKDIVVNQETNISLLNKPINPSLVSLLDMQFGKIKLYQSLLLLTWNEQALFIVDPEIKMIVGTCLNLKFVVDVAVCNDEIFVLQGQRHLIRIASAPEEESSFAEVFLKEPSTLIDLFSPLQEFGNVLKSKTSPPETSSGTDIFSWLHKKLALASPRNLSSDAIPLPDIAQMQTSPVATAQTIPEPTVKVGPIVNANETATLDTKSVEEASQSILVQSKSFPSTRMEAFSAFSNANDCSDFKVIHVKKKKARSSSVPKASLSTIKASPASSTSPNDQENKTDDLDASSCSSSLTESMFDGSIIGQLPVVQSEERGQRKESSHNTNEDDLLDRILNIYSRSKDVSEDVRDTRIGDSTVVEGAVADESDKFSGSGGSVSEEKDDSLVLHDDTSPEVMHRLYPDVVPDPEPKVNERNPLLRISSEDADIYSSISPSSPELPVLPAVVSFSATSSKCPSTRGVTHPESQLLSEWIKCEGPATVVSLCVNNRCLYCVDSGDGLFYSPIKCPKLEWTQVPNCSAHQVTISPSGTILCVLYKGVAQATNPRMDGGPAKKWLEISRDLAAVAVDDSSAWYIKKNGKLRAKKFDVQGYSRPETVNCPWTCRAITCRNNVVWALTSQGTVICRIGSNWEEISIMPNMWVSNIALGSHDTAWLVSDRGSLWFRTGVTAKSPKGTDCWWEVELQPELIINLPERKVFASSLITEKLSNLFLGHQKASVTCGTKGVWFCLPQSSEMIASCGNVIGHCWKKVQLTGIPDAFKWETIAIVDLDAEHYGIWSMYRTGEMFFCTSEELKPISVPVSDMGRIACLASSVAALWVLTTDGVIYTRKDMSWKWPLGSHWEMVNTNQLGDMKLTYVSCSPEIAWGCLESGDVVARVGPLFSPPGLPLVWLLVDEEVASELPCFTKVFVGFDSQMVWAIDSANSVYVREGIEPHFPIGSKWSHVPGLLASHLCILTSHVVAVVQFSGELYVRCGISPGNNFAGDSWRPIPGTLSYIAAASNNIMWGLSSMGHLLRHEISIIHCESEDTIHCPRKRKDSDEDWEMIDHAT